MLTTPQTSEVSSTEITKIVPDTTHPLHIYALHAQSPVCAHLQRSLNNLHVPPIHTTLRYLQKSLLCHFMLPLDTEAVIFRLTVSFSRSSWLPITLISSNFSTSVGPEILRSECRTARHLTQPHQNTDITSHDHRTPSKKKRQTTY